MYVGKTKALISCRVTAAQLICTSVFTYAKIKFPHDTAQIIYLHMRKHVVRVSD